MGTLYRLQAKDFHSLSWYTLRESEDVDTLIAACDAAAKADSNRALRQTDSAPRDYQVVDHEDTTIHSWFARPDDCERWNRWH